MSLFVQRYKRNGLYRQTGYSEGTSDLQQAAIYSPKGQYGWMLTADQDLLDNCGGPGGVEVIRVRLEPI